MNLLIIQARMGSSRLPGKVMKEISNTPLLQILINRISKSKYVDEIIVATTQKSEDDLIVDYCKKKMINFYRGSDSDVLDRFYNAANSFKDLPENIIRICSDNPLSSYKVVDFVINEFNHSGKDYFSNSNHEPDYLEDGFDVEVFTFKSLDLAWRNAKLLSEREHVCPYIKKNFSCGWKKANINYNYKLSVDTQDDFNLVSQIFDELGHIEDFSIEDVVQLITNKPYLLNINKESRINSGYLRSLKNDKKIGE
jgi:spore coat polysaccharide biosynthesis protein SpsF